MAIVQSGYGKVPGAEQGAWRAVRRQVHRIRYDLVDLARRYGGRWKAAVTMLLIQAATPFFVWWRTHSDSPAKTLLGVAALMLAANGTLMFELNARRTTAVAEAKSRRKVKTAEIVDSFSARFGVVPMNALELRTLRGDILQTIASCVASVFVLDPGTCVASLLIRSPEAPDERLRIVARSDGSRQVGIEYPKLGMLAWYAMETARVEVTGEVKRQYVGFRDKQYNSVLSLPILSGDGRVIAAVSVDHANRFLFDGREPMFQTILRPYLRLLAMTFSNMEEASTPTQPG